MKKLLVILAFACALPLAMQADPAKKVNLTYSNGKLKIEAIHKVNDVTTHYIDQIIIIVDGKVVQTLKPTKQSSNESELVEIAVQAKKGSKIEVKTRCNQFGNKSGSIVIQ